MGAIKKIIKKVGKAIDKVLPGTGRSAAKRAANEANAYAEEARADRARLEEKTKKERLRAQKLAIKGLRSRRSVARFNSTSGESPSYGSTTIG